ncbi:MalY/PatB family protein [Actinophytocola sp.]|uniref:MalY/PatB family protein n=1 Tax=Actinophytocola sp. TaxID=1872138 RepID=UPI002EDB380D
MTVPSRHAGGVTGDVFSDVTTASARAAGSFKWTEFGDGLIGAGAAEIDFGTAPPVAAALREAVDAHTFGYLAPAVAEHTRAACARWQREVHGWDVSPDDVRLLPDVVRAFHVAVEHFSRPGSPVIVPTPAYPPFLRVPPMLGRPVVELPMVTDGGRYRVDRDRLADAFTGGAHLLVVCNPHNPVGHVFDEAELSAICAVVERHGGRVFADEVHAPLVYPGHSHVPYASVSAAAAAHTITATSASKAWNLPGLKCAQMLLSNDADRARWDRLNRLATDGTSTLGAVAATAAYRLGRPWLLALLAHLDRNRRLLATLLGEHLPQVPYTQPEGTFLAWLDCRGLGVPSPAAHFAAHAGVATLDGADCGRAGEGFVRLNFGTSAQVLRSAVAGLAGSVALATQSR